jgi:hypothetical protein
MCGNDGRMSSRFSYRGGLVGAVVMRVELEIALPARSWALVEKGLVEVARGRGVVNNRGSFLTASKQS